ncbi:hypothetical protein CEUSTIGMA_g645.t1 [Chlamydomonas eustigma]|uniref:Carbonic anhydrase n=1 Tax=Chlamydomonas eustigma TaxID=1157962 RepID=A0A250WR96_9CHLO|nr:hypothetical protein CEUSTIGMA_g645.t1 [Chlamydomonas eustigma]|eukprot:GAX73192.1 hypothetical protein CEUSTIGMA_g645.t1 [Chlamydomonas eustigma]
MGCSVSCVRRDGVSPHKEEQQITTSNPLVKPIVKGLGLGEARKSKEASPGVIQVTPRNIELQSKESGGWHNDSPRAQEKSRRGSVERRSMDSYGRQKSVEISGRSFARNATLEREKATPAGALEELMNGNTRFILGKSDHPHQDFQRLQAIAPKQKPMAAILSCADSRVPPEIVFDVGFGDIFVCRIAGNLATAEEIASLEYAVLELGVKVIMVMGHTSCGAVKAALTGKAFPGFIDTLVDHLDVAVMRAKTRNAKSYDEAIAFDKACDCGNALDPNMIEQVIRENALYQITRCKRSTIILEAMTKGNLILVPAVYDIRTGEVLVIEDEE